MMSEHSDEISAEYVESGEYYHAARRWYSGQFHFPITQSRYFVIVILLSLINGYFAISALSGTLPIATRVPFIIYSDNIVEDYPSIHPIVAEDRDNNKAVMRYLLQSYVENRESYQLRLFEQRYHNIWGASSDDVFAQYQAEIEPSNPHSPYRLYANNANRTIQLQSLYTQFDGKLYHAQAVFFSTVTSIADSQELSRSKWRADITYQYTPLSVEQRLESHAGLAHFFGLTEAPGKDSGDTQPEDSHIKITPMKLVVVGYQAKELLE